jgi:hypothetical protein
MDSDLDRRRAEYIRSEFTQKWRNKLQVDGEFNLVCGDEETMYLTRPADAIHVWERIKSLPESTSISVVVDGFAGVGGDTLAAMHFFGNVIAVQRGSNSKESMRFNYLKWNTFILRWFFPKKYTVECEKKSLSEFLQRRRLDVVRSLLYLDPPWLLPDGKYRNGEQLQYLLQEECFKYLDNMKPYLICMKLPPLVKTVSKWIEGYDLIDTIELRRNNENKDVKFNVFVLRRHSRHLESYEYT